MKKVIVWTVAIIFIFVSLSAVFAQQATDATRSTPRMEKKAEPPARSEKKGLQKTKKKTKKVRATKEIKKNKEKQKVKKASTQSLQKKNKVVI